MMPTSRIIDPVRRASGRDSSTGQLVLAGRLRRSRQGPAGVILLDLLAAITISVLVVVGAVGAWTAAMAVHRSAREHQDGDQIVRLIQSQLDLDLRNAVARPAVARHGLAIATRDPLGHPGMARWEAGDGILRRVWQPDGGADGLPRRLDFSGWSIDPAPLEHHAQLVHITLLAQRGSAAESRPEPVRDLVWLVLPGAESATPAAPIRSEP